jgi:WD repeat-containing protein 19
MIILFILFVLITMQNYFDRYARALKLFLQCGDKEVERAIQVVGKARSDMLTHTLIDFLMGETDGLPKEAFHIYRLYLALGNYPQAAKTAVIIARQEQDLGNYKQAHSILFETIKQLEEHKVRVPQSLRRPFTLLHSYVLVRSLGKRGDSHGAASMLLRVAESISKFPSHKVPILTSTVIACSKAGLKSSALEYAMQLMRQEYRSHVDPKYKRKIEALVRRPKDANKEEEPTPLSPCPISGLLIPDTCLESPTTKDAIPMCVVTGRHIVADDLCVCPRSGMPAIYSQYLNYIEHEAKSTTEVLDPVNSSPISPSELFKCSKEEVEAIITAHNMPDVKDKEDGAASPQRKN